MPDLAYFEQEGRIKSLEKHFCVCLKIYMVIALRYMISICHFKVSGQFRFQKPLQDGRGILPLPRYNLMLGCRLSGNRPYTIPICHCTVSGQFRFQKPLQEGRGILPLPRYNLVLGCTLRGNRPYTIYDSHMPFYGFWTVPVPETAAGGEGHTTPRSI